MASREELEQTAIRPDEFANVAHHRWQADHPDGTYKDLNDSEQFTAIQESLQLLAAEAISWLVGQGHLAESDGHVHLGSKQFGSYVPGTHRKAALLHSVMRRVTPARLELLRESMQELGDLREYFPVLVDEQGEVVDGIHRRAIDPDWPAARTRVPMESRLAVATAANRSNAWTQQDWQRLVQHRKHISGYQAAVRAAVRLALLEDHERSDRKIANLVGASDKTVAAIRKDLEKTAEIPQFTKSAGGRPRRDGTPAQPRQRHDELDAEVLRLVRAGEPVPRAELGQRFGVGAHVVELSHHRALGQAEAEARREEERPAATQREETAAALECTHCCPVHCPPG